MTALSTRRRDERRRWTRDELVSTLREDPVELGVVNALLAWADERRLRLVGTRAASPGLAWHLDALGWDYTLFIAITRPQLAVTGTHRLGIEFGNLSRRPVLDDRDRMDALIAAIGRISAIPHERRLKYPSIPIDDLAGESALRSFTSAWDAVIADVRRAETESRPPPVVHGRLYQGVRLGAIIASRMLTPSARRRAERDRARKRRYDARRRSRRR